MKTQAIMPARKIAILHEMLVKFWGAEQVVKVLKNMYPEADLYTLIYDEKKLAKHFPKKDIHPSCFSLWSQRVYSLTKKQRLCLPFMPKSVESLDFSEYDIVIVSSSAIAHWLITKPETKIILYYHAPARYLWDWTHESQKSLSISKGLLWYFYKNFLKELRIWDYIASQRESIKIANSKTTQKRLQKYYRVNSQVIFPPVDISLFTKKAKKKDVSTITQNSKDYYLIVSALSEFKKIEIAVQAFNTLGYTLVIVGEGSYKATLQSQAQKNIIFAGVQYWDDLAALYQNSQAIIFPGEEDFWIVPIEAMASGKSVFAFWKWWVTETIIAGSTWEFYFQEDGSDFIETFEIFHKKLLRNHYKKTACRAQAENFSTETFISQIDELVS